MVSFKYIQLFQNKLELKKRREDHGFQKKQILIDKMTIPQSLGI